MEPRDAPKCYRVRRLDSIQLDIKDRTYFTEEGYLVDHPILTSCGIFEYTNPDGSIRKELRLPEYVFAQESLQSYRGKPVIITHEAGVVTKSNVDKEQIGTILSDGYQDGEDVRAEIIIHNTNAMNECGLKELSLGYNLDLLEKPGIWNGEPYDAIQTNIVINHLALVANARAGEQARLNIDNSDTAELKGSKVASIPKGRETKTHQNPVMIGFDELKKEGGKQGMQKQELHTDSVDMTPEELVEAIKMYKASKSKAELDKKPSEETSSDGDGSSTEEPSFAAQQSPTTQEEKKMDGDIPSLIAAVEQLLAALKSGTSSDENEHTTSNTAQAVGSDFNDTKQDNKDSLDSSKDESNSLNTDSTDDGFIQHLTICRIGDKLHMDGLEKKSIMEAKKAIIAKVFPDMRLDGKCNPYVDAVYDMAVCEVNKHKDVSYQKKQMTAVPVKRADSNHGESMAFSARQRMIEREGGNE